MFSPSETFKKEKRDLLENGINFAGAARKIVHVTLVILVATGSFVLAEKEPNNESAKANPVKVGEPVGFKITPLRDIDYFSLTAPGDGVMTFRITKKAKAHRPYVWWGHYKGEDGRSYLRRGGEWDRRVIKGEKLELGVRSNAYQHLEAASDEDLEGVFGFVPAHDKEPNDKPESALPQTMDKEFSFTLLPRQDIDYFTIVSPGDGVVRFNLTQKSNAHNAYPWWGLIKGKDGKSYLRRPGQWDILTTKGQTLTFGIRSNAYAHLEKGSPDILKGHFTFEPSISSEPNDTMAEAIPTEIGKEIVFQINPRLDRDYFSVVSPGKGTVRFRLTERTNRHRNVYPWWGESKGENGKIYMKRAGKWDTDADKGELVTFAIRSSYYEHQEIGSLDVLKGVFEFVPGLDQEPNNTGEQATPAKVSEPLSFQFSPAGDRDYFTLESPGKGTLQFGITSKAEGAPTLYPWWGEVERDGKSYEYRSGKWDRQVTPGETIVFALRTDYYAIRERAWEKPYTGVFKFIPEPGSEPNDTPEQAEAVEIDKPFELILQPTGDRDCFRVSAPGRGILRLERLSADGPHPELFPTWIHDQTAYPGYWATRATAKGEDVIVRLQSHRYAAYDQSSPDVVPLALRFLSEPDAPETGDDPGDTSPVEIGEPFRFALLPSWDRDHFLFTPKKDGYVSLRLITEPPAGKRLAYWWQAGVEVAPVETKVLSVQAGQPVILGLASYAQKWSSEDVLQAIIEYTEAPADPTRRWTFGIKRLAE